MVKFTFDSNVFNLVKKEKLNLVIIILAIGMAIYHLTNCYFSIVGTIEHRMVHLAFAIVLVFFTAMKPNKRALLIILILLMLLSLSAIGYLWFNLERLLFDMGFPLPTDVIAGVIILAGTFVACGLSFGMVLPIMAVILLLYGLLGHYLGGPILSVNEIITTVCLTFGSYDIWGEILVISANVIFLFVFFGGMLQGLRATDFFIEVGKVISRYTRSGPAMTAVVSSAFMGMTTGQATPNIAVTGAFTIPLMKRVGYKPWIAGSIEAAASGGGQIMPPIMSAGAFVMADLLGVSYTNIIVMAIVPAILYFYSVAMFVHLHALKSNVTSFKERVDIKKIYAFGPLFIVPLVVILALLFFGFPSMFAAFWGLASLILLSFITKKTRPSLESILAGCISGATTGARVAVACATLGPIIALVTKTGLGLKIGFSVEMWCGGNLFVGLIILMLAVIILGLEVPTVAAYLIAAIVAIPGLVKLGLNPFQAHMFAFYFGAFSGLTPPVGVAAIVASKIAEAPYIKTALHSINAAAAGFLVPFVFAFNGAILLLPGTGVSAAIFSIVISFVGLGVFQIGFVGYFLTSLNIFERLVAIISGVGFLAFAAVRNYTIFIIAASFFITMIFSNLIRRRRNIISFI